MPATAAVADKYSAWIREAYEQSERLILETCAKTLEKDIDLPDWKAKKLKEVRAIRSEVLGEIGKLRDLEPKIAESIKGAYDEGAKVAVDDLKRASITDIEADRSNAARSQLRALGRAVVEGGSDEATVDAAEAAVTVLDRGGKAKALLIKTAIKETRGTHLRILRTTVDTYRKAVAEGAAQMATGALDRRRAAQYVLNKLADSGISGFVDSRKRNWDMASYVEMAVRSASGQAAVQGHIDKVQANGHDLMIVSDSPEECELCAAWEGKVLSISGDTKGYPTVADATADGLFHPNCTHQLHLYIPGVTRSYTDTPNPQGYEERQKQRGIERDIRRWKRREAASMTDEEKAKAKEHIRFHQAKMRSFIDDTGRLRQRQRESIKGAR